MGGWECHACSWFFVWARGRAVVDTAAAAGDWEMDGRWCEGNVRGGGELSAGCWVGWREWLLTALTLLKLSGDESTSYGNWSQMSHSLEGGESRLESGTRTVQSMLYWGGGGHGLAAADQRCLRVPLRQRPRKPNLIQSGPVRAAFTHSRQS